MHFPAPAKLLIKDAKLSSPKRAPRGTPRRSVSPLLQWELDTALTVVLFAGLGGACQGLEEAGCPVSVANNHDPVALAAHAAIHPHTRHIRGSIWDVDPLEATGGRPVKVLWASPDCTGFSVAAGGAPRSPRVRSLPWQVCRWVGETRPRIVFMENVSEIRNSWTSLVAKRCPQSGRVMKLDGTVVLPGEQVPVRDQCLVPNRKMPGRRFKAFVKHMQALGAVYEDRDLVAADFGVPTTRKRFFGVMRFDQQPINWPSRTHAAISDTTSGLKPWVSFASVVDWSLPMPSIFDRKKPLAPATLRRIAIGLRRFVLETPEPFVLHLTHGGARRIHPVSGPLPTQTCAHRGEMSLCEPKLARIDDLVARGDVCVEPDLMAAWQVQHNLGMVGHDMRRPLSTLTTAGTQQQIAAVYFVKLRGTSTAQSASAPAPTITAGGNHIFAVAAFLSQHVDLGVKDGVDNDEASLPVVMIEGEPHAIVDIGMRMLHPSEAARAHELTLPKEVSIGGAKRPLTKTEASRLIGNSVPKRMARLLAEANQAHTLYLPSVNRLAAD